MREVQKSLPPETLCAQQAADMAQINALAKREMTPEEVYTFSVRLCDNEIDRDGERFDEQTLRELAALFIGKSGIFDHCWSARGQTARIYRAEVCREEGRTTAAGDGYCYVKAMAYMPRTEGNQELIEEIEAGIKKEVSVGCSVREAVCSVCGAARGECEHVHGKRYDGRLCYTELRGAEDAYEWSFVAVPAQREAGVMKRFSPQTRRTLKAFLRTEGHKEALTELEQLEWEAALGKRYLDHLRRETLRYACLAEPELNEKIFASALQKLNEGELLELKRGYQAREEHAAEQPQLSYGAREQSMADGSAFLI